MIEGGYVARKMKMKIVSLMEDTLGGNGRLLDYPIQYYTGHCTGEAVYQLMQGILGSQIVYIRSGGRIEL